MVESPHPAASQRPPGRLLARGRDADVYELDAQRVLRRYRVGERDTEREARVMEHVRAHGYPVPVVYDVTSTDMVLQRVDAPTMADAMAARPWTVRAAIRTLASLHARLRAIPAPSWLDRAPAGVGDTVVHLDLHPLNVLAARDGPVVIDWANAGRGPAGVDVAVTWLLLSAASTDDTKLLFRAVASVGRRACARAFARAADPDGDALRHHLHAAAVLRLHDSHATRGEVAAIRRLVPDA
jgi:Ser/Thr protein kinase RdoA (MazF antagonist)